MSSFFTHDKLRSIESKLSELDKKIDKLTDIVQALRIQLATPQPIEKYHYGPPFVVTCNTVI